MTLDEALSAAVEGERVTAAHMAPGWFVDYPIPFNGWYRNTPNGSRSQFIETEEDRAADWGVFDDIAAAEAKGFAAWNAGAELKANPYESMTPNYAAWVRGYVKSLSEEVASEDEPKRDAWGKRLDWDGQAQADEDAYRTLTEPQRDEWGRLK